MTPLTPEQQRAVEARGKIVCVDAGAGSGKTRVLVQRVIELIERDKVPLGQIAAITFTDKAAGEMKERLRRACREKAPEDNPDRLSFWRRIERQVDTSRISTIHTFCSALLRENALSLQIDPDFAVLTDAESKLLHNDVVTSTLHDLLDEEDPLARLAAEEYGVYGLTSVLHGLLYKRTLAARLDGGAAAEAIAADWARRVPEICDELLQAACRSRDVRRFIRALERCGGACTDPADKREQVRVNLLGYLHKLAEVPAPSVIREIVAQIASMRADTGKKVKGELINWTDLDAYEEIKDVLNAVKPYFKNKTLDAPDPECEARSAEITAAILHVYREVAEALGKEKRARNALDFDDLIARAAEVLRDDTKGGDSVRERTARGLRHVLIDEFQDTDGVQYEIARLLCDAPDGPDLFIVGDAKQSIYYFRGAEVDVFRDARGDARAVHPMRGNFRTTPPVLEFVNEFFADSGLLAAVESPFQPLEPRRTAIDGPCIEFLVPPGRDEKTKIDEYREDEARMIAARLDAVRAGTLGVIDGGTARPARFGDVAILLRSLSNVHLYERALREADIPYTLVAGRGFYERQEIADLRNLLAVLADPCDEMALTAFLRGPVAALTDDALVALAGGVGAPRGVLAGFNSDAALIDPEQDARLRRARSLIAMLRAQSERPLHELLQAVFDASALEAIALRQFMGAQRAGNLRKAALLAESFSGAQPPGLRAFVRYLDEMAAHEVREGEAAPNADDRDNVTIMTVHKAKGLEFPIVFIADAARGAQPGGDGKVAMHKRLGIAAKVSGPDGEWAAPAMYKAIEAVRNDEELAEQARVLYVAMTRARDHLFVSGAPCKLDGNSWLAEFERQYAVSTRRDGETFSGNGWQAAVRRAVPGTAAIRSAMVNRIDADIDRIKRRIGPVVLPSRPRTSVAVTHVIKALHPVQPPHEPRATERPVPRIAARTRGTLVHAFLEQWNFAGDPGAAIDSVLRTEPLDDTDANALRADMQRIAERVRASALGARMAQSTDRAREVDFMLRVDAHVVRGTLDLVLDGNTIIDFKTGEPSQSDLAEYETQLRIYAAALQSLTGAQTPEAYLVLLDSVGELVRAVDCSQPAIDRTAAEMRGVLPALCAAG